MIRVVVAICIVLGGIWAVFVAKAIDAGEARIRTVQRCELVSHSDPSIEVQAARGVWVRGHHWLCQE